jgi:hypothetical protein
MAFYIEELRNNGVSATHSRPILLYSDLIRIYNNFSNIYVVMLKNYNKRK